MAGTSTLRTGLTATGSEPTSLSALENNSLSSNDQSGAFSYSAVGIDLSDLGIAEGATVSGLFLTSSTVDTGFIVGLVPEPSAIALLALGAGSLLMRRRR